jgi:outer membrane immunogenic protein
MNLVAAAACLNLNASLNKSWRDRMKKFLLATVGLVALGFLAPASAADLAARPYTKAPPPMLPALYDWSGFYIGANGGWGSSRKCWDLVSNVFTPGGLVTFPTPVAEGCHDASGGTVGGQIGYRWQASSWVFGLEAQGNWADFRGSNRSLFPPLSGFTNQSRVEAFGLFTGQVGYAWNNVLVYVKGGGAVTDDRYNTFTIPAGGLEDSARETRWGGTVGVGLEYGFAPNWSVAVEYDHLFMGTRNATFTTPAGLFSATDRIRQDVDLVTARINFRWGGPVIAKY